MVFGRFDIQPDVINAFCTLYGTRSSVIEFPAVTPEEYKEATDQLYQAVRERDAAQGSALVWKCVSGLLVFIILWMLAEKWGWI
jgi:hypothetical protein